MCDKKFFYFNNLTKNLSCLLVIKYSYMYNNSKILLQFFLFYPKNLQFLSHFSSIFLIFSFRLYLFLIFFVHHTYLYLFCALFAVETYLSPVETHCMNIDYFIPDEENQTRDFSDDAITRLRKYSKTKQISFFVFYQCKISTALKIKSINY